MLGNPDGLDREELLELDESPGRLLLLLLLLLLKPLVAVGVGLEPVAVVGMCFVDVKVFGIVVVEPRLH